MVFSRRTGNKFDCFSDVGNRRFFSEVISLSEGRGSFADDFTERIGAGD